MLRGTLILAALLAATPSLAQTAAPLAAPPRSIADITAILDQQKPDPALAARLRAQADEQPEAGLDAKGLTDFLFKRGMAAGEIGRIVQKRDDMKKCVEIGRPAGQDPDLCMQEWAVSEMRLGNGQLSLQLHRQREAQVGDIRGRLFGIYTSIVSAAAATGNMALAREYVAKNNGLMQSAGAASGRGLQAQVFDTVKESWRAQIFRA